MTTPYSSAWEFQEFTHDDWPQQPIWTGLAGDDRYIAPQVRQLCWQAFSDQITSDLRTWQAQGWEPITPVGPEAITLRRIDQPPFCIELSDILLWIMTLGVALIIQLCMVQRRHYVYYAPVAFSVKMRRRIAQYSNEPLPEALMAAL